MKSRTLLALALSFGLSAPLLAADAHEGHDHSKAVASEKSKAQAKKTAHKAAKAKKMKEQWTCPMHPEILRSKPGSCPVCHMDLVKKDLVKKEVKK